MEETRKTTLIETYEVDREIIKNTSTNLVKKVQDATTLELTPMEILALVRLRKLEVAKQPTTCSALGAKLDVTLPQVTALNNSLVTLGLTKHSVPAPKPDRRQRLLATTKKGAAVAAVVEGL